MMLRRGPGAGETQTKDEVCDPSAKKSRFFSSYRRTSQRHVRFVCIAIWMSATVAATWWLASVVAHDDAGVRAREALRLAQEARPVVKTNATKKKKGSHHHKRKRRRIQPTASPTSRPPDAESFPFMRPERFILVDAPSAKNIVFRVGPRKDLENFVAPTLRRMGLTETRGMDWQVYVGLQFKPEYEKNYILVPNNSLVASIPGLKETLGDKEAFSRLWRKCLTLAKDKDQDNLCGWTTPSYNFVHKPIDKKNLDAGYALAVEGGAEEFLKHLPRYSHLPSTWIIKPQRRYLSLGMHLSTLWPQNISSLDALAAWASAEVPAAEKKKKHHTKQPGEFSVQRYVERPALLAKRKFDLRLWLLIASVEPLSVFLLDVAFPKISVVDYNGFGLPYNSSTLREKCMHILMMVSEFCTKRMTFPNPFPFTYPGITRPDLSVKAPGRSFFEYLHLQFDEEDFFQEGSPEHLEFTWRKWQQTLWPQLERTVLLPLLLAKPQLREHEKRIFGSDDDASKRYQRFALLSPDAIWDAENQKWLLEEINTNGLFQLGADEEHVKTFHIDEGYTEGWIHLIGADGFPNAPNYQSTLDSKLNDFCQRRGCSQHARQVLERAAHQNAHATGGWYRLFPPVQCEPFCGERDDNIGNDPIFKSYFAPALSELAKLHWEFLAELDRDYFRRLGRSAKLSPDIQEEKGSSFPTYIAPDDT